MTARICHDHFTRVVIVEREGWLNTEDARITHARTQEHRRTNVIQYYSLNGQAKHFVIFADFVTLSQLYSASRSKSSNIFFLTLKSNALRPRFRVYDNTFLNKTVDNPCSIAPGFINLVWHGHEMNLPPDVWHTLPKTMFASRRGYETLLRRLVLDKARYPNIEQIAGTVTEIHPDKENGSRIGSISVRKEDGDIVKLSGECFVGLSSFNLYSVVHSLGLRLYWVYARSNMARQSRIWETESSGQQGAATK